MTDAQVEKIASAIKSAGSSIGSSIMFGLIMLAIMTLQGHCIGGAP